VGACVLAILLKTKNADIKSLSTECLASAWLGGITEPAIYGLLLKYKKPFVVMALSCGLCGAFAAGFGMTQTALITTSLITLPAVYAMCGMPEMIAIVISIVGSFVGTFLFGYSDDMLLEK
jgi:PTS system beta-glucosides-specific IIC component